MITVVDTADKLNQAMETIEGMMTDGLIVTSDVEVTRLAHSSSLEAPDAAQPPR